MKGIFDRLKDRGYRVEKYYWTLQTNEAWDQFRKHGFIVGSSEFSGFSEQYKWMMKQMSIRLNKYNNEYPIWVWLKKPDMRTGGFFRRGTRCVRIQLNLNEEDVLVSDFMDWHCVLNNNYLSDNEQDWDEYIFAEDNGIDNDEIKQKSWEKIFHWNRIRDVEWEGTEERVLQGVTGKIELNKIMNVEHFIAR
ncbi:MULTISPECIES: DUF3841 domain-containing protein [unclassified Paenibacillus]|uniref:DUF3841 domain-containing protein n=1 Tax=unclassified Paenibacillus TaxID=185978 RepID=UPI0027D84F74|nr:MULTISPECIES: DUF3841 domain-containing protein [unclassified Paenibacillus]